MEWGGRVEREEGGRRRGTWAGAAGRRRGRGRGRRRRRRDGSRASELVRVLVVEEEDGGGPSRCLGWSWGGRRPRASRVGGGRRPAPRARTEVEAA